MNNKFLLLFFLSFFLSQECQFNEIQNYDNKCITIEYLLDNKDLQLNEEDINYFTSEIKEISKNGYNIEFLRLDDKILESKQLSIYISNKCLNNLEKELKIDISNALVIVVSNSNKKNINGVPETYFVIRYITLTTGENKYINSKTYDFSKCNSDPILLSFPISIDTIQISKKKEKENAYDPDIYELCDLNIERILFAQKSNIDLFNIHSEFFEDICFKFKSEKGSDVTLETRLMEYYQNITLCNINQNAHYMYFNYNETLKTLVYTCAYGFYKDEKEKNDYIEKIDQKVNLVFKNSNFKVITCYKELFNYKQIYKNYGFMICAFVLLMQLIFFLSYCCVGTKPLKKQIEKLISKATKKNSIKSNLEKKGKEFAVDSERINFDKEQKKKEQNNHTSETNPNNENDNKNYANPNNENDNKIETNTNNDNKIKENPNNDNKIEINPINANNENKKNESNSNNENPPSDNINSEPKIPQGPINDNEGEFDKNTEISEKKDVEIVKGKENDSFQRLTVKEKLKIEKIMKKRSSQIFDLDNDDLNELSFQEAKLFDKRNFCVYYCFMIQRNHIIINTFCRVSDYNLFSIKLGLLLFSFPINLAFNSFFFTSKQIQSVYINKLSDISIDWQNFVRSFAASIISTIILIFLKFLCLTHDSIRKLKKNTNIEEAKKDMVWTLRCIKLRIFIYYIISIIFIVVFGFYIGCFCEIFENTQILLLETMAFSWALTILYPFVVCFITSIFRRGSLTCGKKGISCCYGINKILQLI